MYITIIISVYHSRSYILNIPHSILLHLNHSESPSMNRCDQFYVAVCNSVWRFDAV